ncbi:amino acid ABC transporter permease [Rhodococcus sovatensis]|uniref:Amino acid ABC transporter permease n=1 Tax=Rhodococcus sovatensis TaxID=1805840 RepID=A0ABZ2PLJ1_9NOCA
MNVQVPVQSPVISRHDEIAPIARRWHVGRIVGAAIAAIIVALLAQSFFTNEAVNWPMVRQYFFSESILDGLEMTLLLTAVSMAIALILATLIANMRLSENPVLRAVSSAYVWLFRGIPLLVLLILMFNFALLYPTISLSLPGVGTLWSASSQDLISPFWAAIIAFSVHQSSYTSEVIRSSILAVSTGQVEAAEALGMSKLRTFRRIVLPQALRIAVPPIANDTINLLKGTALVAFISVADLLYSVQQIYTRNFQVVPLLIVATIWYVLIVSVMSVGQTALERRLGRSSKAKRSPAAKLTKSRQGKTS